MLKPAGSLCNLDCHYCYYLDKAGIYGGREPRMSEEMLETVVREYIAANEVEDVTFNWHGGEPLILGKDFYRKALAFERKYGEGRRIHNTVQTNGTLLDGEWADIFLEGDFLVGISLDGPADIHDKFRRDKGGHPTFARVMEGLGILRDRGVEFNTMSTVNRRSEGRGLEVYSFLKSVGSRYMQFMPVVEHVKYPAGKKSRPHIVPPDEEGAEIAPWSVRDMPFGKFLCDIYDYWVKHDVGSCFVNYFDCTLANWCGVPPGTCSFAETCGGTPVVEHNGDMYSCDHFVYPEYLLGNISRTPMGELASSPRHAAFGTDKRGTLPSRCLRCKWLFCCNGECPKHRFNRTENGETGLSALCGGYYMFFEHVAPGMKKMKEFLEKGLSPACIMLSR